MLVVKESCVKIFIVENKGTLYDNIYEGYVVILVEFTDIVFLDWNTI
jgi:hypothetical protein